MIENSQSYLTSEASGIEYYLTESLDGPENDSLLVMSGHIVKQLFPDTYGYQDVKSYLVEEQGDDIEVVISLMNPYHRANLILNTVNSALSFSLDMEQPLTISVNGVVNEKMSVFSHEVLDIIMEEDVSVVRKAIYLLMTNGLDIDTRSFSQIVKSSVTIDESGGLVLYCQLPESQELPLGEEYHSESPITLTYLPGVQQWRHKTYMAVVYMTSGAGRVLSEPSIRFNRFSVSVSTQTLTPIQEVEPTTRLRIIDYLAKM